MRTIHTTAHTLRTGELSPVDLLDAYLERIDRLEEHVRAWVLVDRERARAEAQQRAAELHKGQWRGPLHGIPVGIKDIIDIFDWPTAAGSQRWQHSVARHDAEVVRRLRQAGAVMVGKTVTTQFASFDPPITRNPWNRERTPGGSSSGSAAATACGMCLAAIGSQTGGSITRPASYCGLASCKPTFGRVSTVGVMPLASSMDHVGPLAACVTDLALLMNVIAGHDSRDPLCAQQPVPDYVQQVNRGSAPPRLGRVRGLFESKADAEVRTMMARVSQQLQEAGARVVEVALPASFNEVIPRHWKVMAVESAAYHGERLARYPDDYLPRIRGLVEDGLACPAPEYATCKEHQRALREQMRTCFLEVDALLTPATTCPAPVAETTGDPAFNSPWSYTGYPTVSIPTGWSAEHLPLAIQLVGLPWTEGQLLGIARWCEQTLAFEVGEAGEG